MIGFLHTTATHRPHPEDMIYAFEHIAYNYVFITPPRTPIMRVAESAMRASQRVSTEAARRSYIRSTEFLFPLYAMDDGDSDYMCILRPEMLGLTELPPRKVYNKRVHGRRWHNKPWPEVLAHLQSFLSTDYWLDRHRLRALMEVSTQRLIWWLKQAVAEKAIEKRMVTIHGGGDTPQYRLWQT